MIDFTHNHTPRNDLLMHDLISYAFWCRENYRNSTDFINNTHHYSDLIWNKFNFRSPPYFSDILNFMSFINHHCFYQLNCLPNDSSYIICSGQIYVIPVYLPAIHRSIILHCHLSLFSYLFVLLLPYISMEISLEVFYFCELRQVWNHHWSSVDSIKLVRHAILLSSDSLLFHLVEVTFYAAYLFESLIFFDLSYQVFLIDLN